MSGPTGHAEFVDAFLLGPNTSKTVTKNADDVYLITVYVDNNVSGSSLNTDCPTLLWQTASLISYLNGVGISNFSATSCTFSSPLGGYSCVVTLFKFVSDGEQPEPVAPTYDELNLTVLTKTTNGETTASDHDAAMAAMEAAASGAFHYKLNGDVYVISSSALNDSSAKADNVWYCVGEKWYDGTNTLVFESSDYTGSNYWTVNTTNVQDVSGVVSQNEASNNDAVKYLIENYWNNFDYHYKLTNGADTPIYICTDTQINAETISATGAVVANDNPTGVRGVGGTVQFKSTGGGLPDEFLRDGNNYLIAVPGQNEMPGEFNYNEIASDSDFNKYQYSYRVRMGTYNDGFIACNHVLEVRGLDLVIDGNVETTSYNMEFTSFTATERNTFTKATGTTLFFTTQTIQ